MARHVAIIGHGGEGSIAKKLIGYSPDLVVIDESPMVNTDSIPEFKDQKGFSLETPKGPNRAQRRASMKKNKKRK